MAENGGDGYIAMREVAERQDISLKYLEKILPLLVEAGLIAGVHGKGGLLVLIERKTRYYIIVRLRAISQSEVLRALRQAIRRGRLVKALTITTDNGSEFLDHKAIEGLFKSNCKTKVYYTHAYAAWEKGSVENANRLVRRWYPKGTDFSKVSLKRIADLERCVNSIHRKLLKGRTANEAYLSAA